MKTAVLAVLILCRCAVATVWTTYDQPFTFECPDGEILNTIESIHDNSKEDRIWNFTCTFLHVDSSLLPCAWDTDYVNEFQQPLVYQCPNDDIIIGIDSYHHNDVEDRRFKFKCCKVGDFVTHACVFTPYVNKYDEHFKYSVPEGWVLRGIESVHSTYTHDRMFRFDICKLDQISDGSIAIGR